MPHDVTLISTIAVGFVLAFVFGFLANRLRVPPLVGYLLAGVVIGPSTPGFVADQGMAGQLAEIGVIQEYLPRQMDAAEIAAALEAAMAETGAASIRDVGKVMAVLKAKYAGQMDFGAVGALVKARFG